MLSGKAYARALRGHMLSAAAIWTLLFEEFWNDMSPDEQTQLNDIFESPNPLLRQNDDVSLKVLQLLMQKKGELTSKSRTCTLRLNYLMYVEIVQQYIEAERKNDWSSHVLIKQMINLFAATGHNNYAKTCRLYIQSISNLERDHPDIFEQFIAGNHTMRHSEKS